MSRNYMKMVLLLLLNLNLPAENYLLNGGQESVIKYRLIQKIEPTPETVTINLSFVEPKEFISPTYQQKISNFRIYPGLTAKEILKSKDEHGNLIHKYSWENPDKAFEITLSFAAETKVSFEQVQTSAPFPVRNIPADLKKYLAPTNLVQMNDNAIKSKSAELTVGSSTQFDAVQRILSWIIDHMNYILNPEKYDALYSFGSRKGNCQNYSHLAAALMRSAGIPVRIVNGVTLKKSYDVKMGNQTLTLNMAEGRHSWIEVYFPDLGWMPFDPQQSELFVSNRFIRIEVGIDNEDTENDGLVHWTRKKGATAVLGFQELIESEFKADLVSVAGEKQNYGPKKLLLLPAVAAGFSQVELPEEPVIEKPDQQEILQLNFAKSYEFGNLAFPEGVNFAFNRETIGDKTGTSQTLQKSFLVETAEYVTSNTQYCQVFALDKPMKLNDIALALQKFGGTGEIWLELRENENSRPGPVAARSNKIILREMQLMQGYYWVTFDFTGQGLILSPDKYWISLGYSGTPIVNWFYSYGKPVGPIDGTRYKLTGQTNWDKSVGFELNYRIRGLIP